MDNKTLNSNPKEPKLVYLLDNLYGLIRQNQSQMYQIDNKINKLDYFEGDPSVEEEEIEQDFCATRVIENMCYTVENINDSNELIIEKLNSILP